jgi:hypothetical protein
MNDYHEFKHAHEVHIEKVANILVIQLLNYLWS